MSFPSSFFNFHFANRKRRRQHTVNKYCILSVKNRITILLISTFQKSMRNSRDVCSVIYKIDLNRWGENVPFFLDFQQKLYEQASLSKPHGFYIHITFKIGKFGTAFLFFTRNSSSNRRVYVGLGMASIRSHVNLFAYAVQTISD